MIIKGSNPWQPKERCRLVDLPRPSTTCYNMDIMKEGYWYYKKMRASCWAGHTPGGSLGLQNGKSRLHLLALGALLEPGLARVEEDPPELRKRGGCGRKGCQREPNGQKCTVLTLVQEIGDPKL